MLKVNGFYGHIRQNDLRSIVMFLGFVVACQLIGIAILIGPLLFFDMKKSPIYDFTAYMGQYGTIVFVVTVLIFLYRFFSHVEQIKQSVNFKSVSQKQEPRLHRIIEVQAISAGIAMPGVGIIEDDALNAFACGMNERTTVVVVTRGLLRALDDDELEAVIAHEISHIVNGDVCLMAVVNVMLSTLFLLKEKNPVRIKGAKQIIFLVLMPPFLILFLTAGLAASIGMTIAKFSRLVIVSSREFIADAEAVRMTKNPSALISALKTIEGRSEIPDLDETVNAMMIDGAVEGAYASHPTISERIAALTEHAGSMAYAAGVRQDTRDQSAKETRFYGDIDVNANAVFAQKILLAESKINLPKKSLWDRVNTDSNENAFGLTPKMRMIVLAIFVVPAIFPLFLLQGNGGNSLVGESRASLKEAGFNAHGADTGNFSAKSNLTQNQHAKQLGKMDPIKARCYAHRGYTIGDRGRHEFYIPDDNLVTNYVNTGKYPSGIKVEKYVAYHSAARVAVLYASDQEALEKATINYVKQRKQLLMVMHRFYGDVGLDWMLEAYESDNDKDAIAKIKAQYSPSVIDHKGNKAKEKKAKQFTQEIVLLLDNSRDFIPCYARAGIERIKKQEIAVNTSS